jgi:hypothetical protein
LTRGSITTRVTAGAATFFGATVLRASNLGVVLTARRDTTTPVAARFTLADGFCRLGFFVSMFK